MNEIKLGSLVDDPAAGRDAIHIAVVPVTASERLGPGQHVGIAGAGDVLSAGAAGPHVGIVDPYLNRAVMPGDRFWLCLYPYTVTSLRHVWTHPAFPVGHEFGAASSSEVWIREFAERVGLSYAQVMGGAADWLADREYLCFGGLLEGEYVPDEFWSHYEAVTGKKVGDDDRGSFFTCSC